MPILEQLIPGLQSLFLHCTALFLHDALSKKELRNSFARIRADFVADIQHYGKT